MTNLTEQWQKGELINGKKYYITFSDSEPFEATFRAAETIFPFWNFEANGRQYSGYDCIKVLAEVPSYEECEQLLSDQLAKNEGEEINAELEAENTKLKKLLKECKRAFKSITDTAPACFRTNECPLENGDGFDQGCERCAYVTAWQELAKTNQVLGEE